MVEKIVVQAVRKEWIRPNMKKLEAGAAETGTRIDEDGNLDTFNARS